MSVDLPPDVITLNQEKGLPGQYSGARPNENGYYIFGSLSLAVKMYKQILSPLAVKGADHDDFRVFQKVINHDVHVKNMVRDYQKVLKLLVTPT